MTPIEQDTTPFGQDTVLDGPLQKPMDAWILYFGEESLCISCSG